MLHHIKTDLNLPFTSTVINELTKIINKLKLEAKDKVSTITIRLFSAFFIEAVQTENTLSTYSFAPICAAVSKESYSITDKDLSTKIESFVEDNLKNTKQEILFPEKSDLDSITKICKSIACIFEVVDESASFKTSANFVYTHTTDDEQEQQSLKMACLKIVKNIDESLEANHPLHQF